MNRYMLIDAIVRQTMVLIARLATTGGKRISLAHLANQLFVDLTNELRANNLRSKVIADMFGLTLRAYHTKKKRLSESQTDRGKSLWEGVVTFLSSNGSVSREKVLQRFRTEDHVMVTGILNDLVESGTVFRSGRGANAFYRLVTSNDSAAGEEHREESIAAFLLTLIYRLGPISPASLSQHLPTVEPATVMQLLRELEQTGRVNVTHEDSGPVYHSNEVVLTPDEKEGWEASVFDHFQAVANVIAASAEQAGDTTRNERIGGSTFHFDLSEEHPLREDVLRFFTRIRTEGSALRRRIDEYNRSTDHAHQTPFRVVLYLGQNILAENMLDEE